MNVVTDDLGEAVVTLAKVNDAVKLVLPGGKYLYVALGEDGGLDLNASGRLAIFPRVTNAVCLRLD